MYILFHDPVLVAFGSFIAIFIWYLASEYFLVKWYHVQWMKNLIYMMIMIGLFFVASMVPNLVIGFGAYLVAYAVVSWIMFKGIIEKNVSMMMRKI